MARTARVALVGRATVGKSTLFNRLATGANALVSAEAGTTRDRREGVCHWRGVSWIIVDTGGLDDLSVDTIRKKIAAQVHAAIKEADLVLFVVDTRAGMTELDRRIARELQRLPDKHILLVANKADTMRDAQAANEFFKLGLGNPWPVAAASGVGTGDLLDEILQHIHASSKEDEPGIRVGIIGRPNVGKSSLVNALVGEERVIVHDEPYTTRDAHDIPITFHGTKLILVDTAGVRRKSRISRKSIESESVRQSLSTIEKADVVIFVTEAHRPIPAQDRQLAELIKESNAGMIIIGNKWDLVPEKDTKDEKRFTDYYRSQFNFMEWAPLIFMSAKDQTKLTRLKEKVVTVYGEKFRRITENALSKFLKDVIKRHKPTRGKGAGNPYIYRIVQVDVNPPQFSVQVKEHTSLRVTYLNFIEKQLRAKFGFEGSPIKMWIDKVPRV
ncbi:MAG: ribosome biogenesis GTPase Der [Patescibacteria group bacterium]